MSEEEDASVASSGVLTCDDDLCAENALLREEMAGLKQSLRDQLKAEAEVARLKAELERQQIVNTEQADTMQALQATGSRLQTSCTELKKESSVMRMDLLRLLPLQAEKDTLRRQRDENRASLIRANNLLEERAREGAAAQHALTASAAELLESHGETSTTRARLMAAETDNAQRTADLAVLTLELDRVKAVGAALLQQREQGEQRHADSVRHAASQAREIGRQTGEVQRLRQELLVVKSKLSLRDDALRQHQEQQQEQPQEQQRQLQQWQQHQHQQQQSHGSGLRSQLLAMRGWTLPSASASAPASTPDGSASDAASSRASAEGSSLQARGRPPGGVYEQHPSCVGSAGLADLLDMPSCTPFALFGGAAQVKAAV